MPIKFPDEIIPGGSGFKIVSTQNITVSTVGINYIPIVSVTGIFTQSNLFFTDGYLHITTSNDVSPFSVSSTIKVQNLNADMIDNYHISLGNSSSILVFDGTKITSSIHTQDDFYGSWMSHAQCLARISLRI